MEGELFSLAIFNPGSDLAAGLRPSQIILGRTGNEHLVGYQPVPAFPNPNPPQPQIDIFVGDLTIDDPAFRQWNDTFILGDWEAPYYANQGLNDLGVILDFNTELDTIQLHGSANDYQVADVGFGSAILFQTATGPDVVGVVFGVSDLSLDADYFQFRGTTPPPGPVVPEVQQLGTLGFDAARAVAADPEGNVYVAGGTTASIGAPNVGGYDGFVTKYDTEGNQLFSLQLGTSGYEEIFGVRTDNQGNFYVSGLTDSSLFGPMQSQQYDAFVAKYDSNGNQLWSQQVGQNVQFPTFDLAVDANTGDVFISGPDVKPSFENPDDAYVIKFDTNGNQQWITEVGTSGGFTNFDESYGVTVGNDGSVYATGWTGGDLGGPNQGLYDNWLAKYDNATGAVQWIAQYGTPDYEWSWATATDSQGFVYTTGWTLGDLGGNGNAGSYDAYLTKFDSQGTLQWIQQFGTAADDEARSLFIDANDNIFLTGYTTGDLGGTNAGSFDAWAASFDTSGNQQWITQFGTPDRDDAVSITADNLGNLYVAGDTQGSLGALNAGSFDGWVAKLDAQSGSLLSFNGNQPVAGGDDTSFDDTSEDISFGETSEDISFGDTSEDISFGDTSEDTSFGETSDETVFASEGNNQLFGGDGDDTIYGSAGDDIIEAGEGNNLIYASEGNNTITAGSGNDEIYAGAGDDIINAGGGDDLVYASEGDNIIYGGIGDNTVYSGSGSDLFALTTGEGSTTVINFGVGQDLLGLTDGLTFEQLSITQGTNGDEFFTQIGVGDDLLATLSWVQADSITSSSFTLV
jgi:hypothetical protein